MTTNVATLAKTEIRSVARTRITLVVCVVIVAAPTLYGLLIRSGYTLVDKIDFFSLMLSDVVPLAFPLLVTAVYLPRVSDEFGHNFVASARARTSLNVYLGSRILAAAALSFGVFFAMVALAWIVAFVVEPAVGFNTYRPESMGLTAAQLSAQTGDRFTYSQILPVSPVLFGLVYSMWVGLNAAAWAVLGVLMLMVIENRFVALSVPFLAYQVIDFALAILGVEEFGVTPSIFPFGIDQQPIWHTWVPLLALVAVCGALWTVVSKRNFEVAGLS